MGSSRGKKKNLSDRNSVRSTSSTRSALDTKLKIRSIKRSGKKNKKSKTKNGNGEEKKVTPNVIRTKVNKKLKKQKHKKTKKQAIENDVLEKEMAQKRKINRSSNLSLNIEHIERSQSDQSHIKQNVASKDCLLHRSKSSMSTTPSIGPQKGKRIDSIAALIAKKKRKRSVLENDKSADLNIGSVVNKKRKLNEEQVIVVKDEMSEKIVKNKKRKKKKKKKDLEVLNVDG